MQIPQTKITITKDGEEIARHVVEPGEYVIGRETECEIVVPVEGVSRKHAKLTVNYNELLIEDAGSSNGTFVNGKPVKEATRLWPNQKIQIGTAVIELHRVKTGSSSDHSLAPSAATMRRILPDEFLREKKYDIGGIVAQGGMGAILNATEATTERTVAMKVMLDTGSPDDMVRFITEAKVTAQLEHPNVVPVHELSVDEHEQVFYTMKFVKGVTMRKVLENLAAGDAAEAKEYPLAALLTVYQKVCDAVAFAHSKGVIHRDLKPENIMIGDYGEVLVMDWGLAKVLGQPAVEPAPGNAMRSIVRTVNDPTSAGTTMVGSVLGTPQYMSPEQASGDVENLDVRTDIYALGAILYHILALRPPLNGDDPYEVVQRVREGRIDRLTAPKTKGHGHLPGGHLPDSLVAVCRKAMALDKTLRYLSVPELQKDIGAYQHGFATSAERAGAWKQFTLFVHRNKAASIGVAAALFLSAGFTAKVIADGRRAKAALEDLLSAAPTLISQARDLIDQQKFDDALTKIDFAIKIDKNNADYRLLRAQVLEATLQLDKAAAEFRKVLALEPNDSAAANLALCEKLLRDNKDNAELDEPSMKLLHEMFIKEQRTTQDVPVSEHLGLGRAATTARVRALFDTWRKLPGWEKTSEKDRFRFESDGTVMLVLNALPVSDLSILKGIPISNLNIAGTKVEDLSPLEGLRLVHFFASGAPISDLSPLRGMPLTSINLGSCRKVEDLSALAELPLESCLLSGVQATDFSPLKKCPIKDLNLSSTLITTLEPFAGMQCETLTATGAKALVDISAVRTMRLRNVNFSGSSGIADLAPLSGCPNIEQLLVPGEAKNVASLRRLTKLRSIVYGSNDRCAPEELWVTLGIADARDKEHVALIQKARTALTAAGSTPNPDPNWVKVLPDGTLDLVLSGTRCTTLTTLRGLQVSVLDINTSSITDLSPLANMPLRQLKMNNTRIANLAPLAKCRKLEVLFCWSTAVRDLAPLAGLPLVDFEGNNNSFSSIAPLAGMPLKEVNINGTSVSDISPLLSCPNLEWLTIPTGARDVGKLRALKKLVRLSDRYDGVFQSPFHTSGPAQTAAEFWKDYDAKHPPGK